MALQRRVSNRILRIEIVGADEGKALVAMIDEASDPQANVAELLTSAGFAAPAPITTSSDQQVDQTTNPAAETHGGKSLKLSLITLIWKPSNCILAQKTDPEFCNLDFNSKKQFKTYFMHFSCVLKYPLLSLQQPVSLWSGLVLSFPLKARQWHC